MHTFVYGVGLVTLALLAVGLAWLFGGMVATLAALAVIVVLLLLPQRR